MSVLSGLRWPKWLPKPSQSLSFYAIFTSLCLSLLMSALDSTIVATALPTLLGEFSEFHNVTLPGIVYMLSSTVLVPIYGKLSDIIGRKIVLLFVLVCFVIGSILCGIAKQFTLFILFRSIQGIGAGGIFPLAVIIITDICPQSERSVYTGIVSALYGAGCAIGPVLGGLFVDHWGWRYAFFANAPFGVISILLAYFYYVDSHTPQHILQELKRLDMLGAVLFIVSTVCILTATNSGGITVPWNTPYIIGLYCGGGVGLIAFIFVEAYVAKDPVIPLRLIKMHNMVAATLVSLITGMVSYGMLDYTPVYWIFVHNYTATQGGLTILPATVAFAVAAVLTSIAISRLGFLRLQVFASVIIMAVGAFVIAFKLSSNISPLIYGIPSTIIGFGYGMALMVVLAVIEHTVEAADIAVSTSFTTFIRICGAVFGLAIQNTILFNGIKNEIAILDEATVMRAAMTGGIELSMLPPQQLEFVHNVFSRSLAKVFMMCGISSALSAVVVFMMKKMPTANKRTSNVSDKDQESSYVDDREMVEYVPTEGISANPKPSLPMTLIGENCGLPTPKESSSPSFIE
ncbi:MFS general substrate transporter [Ramicandelaber brevisporus]|nr:MFS general substrate transporter [Ramicandelaber brevisporus]